MRRLIRNCIGLAGLVGFVVAADAAAPPFKTRALWVDPESFASAEATERTLDRCVRAGINTILPNVMCYGKVSFKSSHFQGRVLANDSFDPLGYLLLKAHAIGIQVQPWCCVYYEGTAKPLRPEWEVRSFDGRPFDKVFLSPGNPEVNPYLLSVISDLLAYEIDGIHLDYIRYPGTAYDYSEPARRAFEVAKGFDPQDFLDHVERIVPPDQEPFPVRVLHARSHVERVWETTALERNLDQAGVGFGFLSESPAQIAALRTPGLLILSSYPAISAEMLSALDAYVSRGGNILWSDLPTGMLRTNTQLQQLTGLSGGEWKAKQRLRLQPVGDHRLARLVTDNSFRATVNCATTLNGAELIAALENGRPAITLQQAAGKGRVLALGFDVMESTAGHAVSMVGDMVRWCREQAGVREPDRLAAKRTDWVNWRGEQVTQLVRDLSKAVKRKDARLVVTSSGGTDPSGFFACYRDSGRWLAEGSNDFLFPMNYTPDPTELAEMLETQIRFTPPDKRDRVFPGLQIYATATVNGEKVVRPLEARVVEAELREVQAQGYEGFCLFACNSLSDEIIEVVRRFSR